MNNYKQYEQEAVERYIRAYRAGDSATVAAELRYAAEYDRLNPRRGLRQRMVDEAFRGIPQD